MDLADFSVAPRQKIIAGKLDSGRRLCFVHEATLDFITCCRALEIRGLLKYATNPIRMNYVYQAYYADLDRPSQETYDLYAWMVHAHFDEGDVQYFERMFPQSVLRGTIPPFKNPNTPWELAEDPRVRALLQEYDSTDTPLTFYNKPFLAEGVVALLESLNISERDGRRGLILNFSTGMAKTRTSFIAAQKSGIQKVLVMAPKTAIATAWPKEFKKFNFENFYHISREEFKTSARYDILSWDELLKMPEEFFVESKYKLIIGDEIHVAESEESEKGKRLAYLMHQDQERVLWGLTATAIRKRPSDFCHLLSILNHPIINTNGHYDPKKLILFYIRYCGGFLVEKRLRKYWVLKNPKNLDELQRLLQDVIFSRDKSETDLPLASFMPVHVMLPPAVLERISEVWKTYAREKEKNLKKLSPDRIKQIKMGVLRKAAAQEMVIYTIAYAERLLLTKKKVILFTAYTAVWEALRSHFGAMAVAVNGSVSGEARAQAEILFQTDPGIRVFVGNEKAAGVSMTLTAATDTVFNDFSWLTSDIEQASGRNNRGGSTEEAINHLMWAPGTVTETLLKDYLKHQKAMRELMGRKDAQGVQKNQAKWLEGVEFQLGGVLL